MAESLLKHLLHVSPAVMYWLQWREGAPLPKAMRSAPWAGRVTGCFVPTFISDHIREMTGFEPKECLDPDWWITHVHADDRASVLANLESLLQNDRLHQTYRLQRRDGRYIWVEDHLHLVRDAQGRPIEAVGSWLDVSDHVEKWMAYEQMVESAFDGIAVLQDGKVAFVNRAALKALGDLKDEVIGRSFLDLVHPEDRATALAKYQARMSGAGDGESYAIRLVAKDGRPTWVEISASLIEYRGRPADLVIMRDIGMRKQKEKLDQWRQEILGMIADADCGLRETLNAIVRAAQDCRPGMIGSILLLDEDGKHLRHGAAPDLPEDYARVFDGAAIGPKACSCGTAAYRRERVIVEDIAHDPLWEDYAELALSHGLAACWSEPVFGPDGRVLGTFAMYYRTPRGPDANDIELIEDMAALTANAIVHKRAASALIRREAQLEVLARAGRLLVEELDEDEISSRMPRLILDLVGGRSACVAIVRSGKACYCRMYSADGTSQPVEVSLEPGECVSGHVLATRQAYLTNDARNDPQVDQNRREAFGFERMVAVPILDEQGEVLGCLQANDTVDGRDFDAQDLEMLTMLADIAGETLRQSRSARRMRTLNRTLRLLRDCTQALMRAQEEKELLERICGLLVDVGGYRMAWVGEAVRNGDRLIKPLAWAGKEAGYLQSVRITWGDDEHGQGPSGRAVRSARPVVCQDIPNEPSYAPWRDQALKRGYQSSVAFPLKTDGRVWGVLNIYAADVRAFDAEELALLEELAADLGFGVEVLRQRKEKESLEKQFIQAQKMEAVGTLAGGIAHDFNNMLAAMIGTAYLLRQKLADHPEAVQKIRAIEKTGFRAAEMIKQMLTFARKGELNRQPMALHSFVKEVVKLARSSVPEYVDLIPDVEQNESCLVEADGMLVQQVLLNLIHNAAHAVQGVDHPEIRVRLRYEKPDKAWLELHGLDVGAPCWAHLTVTDNGCGMSEEVRKRIFEPFFTTKNVGEGTGLGLAMCLGAVQSHGGLIDAESEEGRGTTMHIWLPVLASKKSVATAEDKAAPMPGRGELVLLADDEAGVCEVTREVLEYLGYRVVKAADGEQALSLFQKYEHEVRLVVLDVVMPHLGGVEALTRMRAKRPDLPVIFQTGYGEDLVLRGIGDLKRGRVMTKPVDVLELSRTLRQLLDESEAVG